MPGSLRTLVCHGVCWETSWQRNRLAGGRKGKEMKFTKLGVIEEDAENEVGASTWLGGAEEFSTGGVNCTCLAHL